MNWPKISLDHIPAYLWAAPTAVLLLLALIAFPIARRHAYKAGQRVAGKTQDHDAVRDRRLFVAALTPAVLFWLAVLGGSFKGLTAFAREELGWTGPSEWLVPLTLDGVAIAFGLLAFRAIRKRRAPDRAYRVVWGAALASAAINFAHELQRGHGHIVGASYLALLSLFGMVMFHEFLDQFEDGTEYIKRERPKFGVRWLTWPTNTFCAAIAWRNYPPADGAHATVLAAVEHLEQVRVGKRKRRAERLASAPTSSRWRPFARVIQLQTELAEQRNTLAERQTEHDRITAELAAGADAERARATVAEQSAERLKATLTEQMERLRTAHTQQLEQTQAEHAERLTELTERHQKLAAEQSAPRASNVTPLRSGASGNRRATAAPKPATRASDDNGAVHQLFTEHPHPDFDWSVREVSRITGAGFSGRAPRLHAMAMEHLDRCAAERHDRCFRSGMEQVTERTSDTLRSGAQTGGADRSNTVGRSGSDDDVEQEEKSA